MSEYKWVVTAKRADFDAIAEKYNIDKVTARIIRNRDVISDEDMEMFLRGGLDRLHDPFLMKDMDRCVSLLREKISEGVRIRIIGDYDVDGICSTYILLRTLGYLKAKVDTVIPHRILDGYGLNDQLIDNAYKDGIDTIITCDNGISAKAQIERANAYGMTVLVTDHHEVPYVMEGEEKKYILPPAFCVVDPKREDCLYPFKGICGAVVAYKLANALLGESFLDISEELLPFAAMATVCDVMDLLDENRIIVREGLRLMEDPVNIGLKALIFASGLSEKKLSAYHLGFVIGPSINATGRLDTAQRAMDLFKEDSFRRALIIATELKELNDARKKLTEDGTLKACRLIEEGEASLPNVLVVYLNDCHESIAGIIAGRIKEKYYRPSIVLTDSEGMVKGSGRSIEAYDMYEELTKVNDLFVKYGGHKMAAGLTVENVDSVEELRRRLNDNANLSGDDLAKKIKIDVPMPLYYVSEDLIRQLDILEPCGNGNPRPLFADKNISLISYEKRGKTRLIGKLKLLDEWGNAYEGVYFDDLEKLDNFLISSFGSDKFSDLLKGNCKKGDIIVKIAYNPDINVYNNIMKIQMIIKYIDL